MGNLNLSVAMVNSTKKVDLLNALRELASNIDADFSGENGEDYAWAEVKKHNELLKDTDENYFDSNMEYLLNELKELDGEILVEKYVESWLRRDAYYIDYELVITKDNDGNIRNISLATLS